jgi:hypothetical protein
MPLLFACSGKSPGRIKARLTREDEDCHWSNIYSLLWVVSTPGWIAIYNFSLVDNCGVIKFMIVCQLCGVTNV